MTEPRHRLTSVFAFAVAVALLLLPAIWNGLPLIYPDTGGYLLRPLTGTLELGRSALYGIFLLDGASLDFWPPIAAQAALSVWVVALTLRINDIGKSPGRLLAVVTALTAATSLPFFVSQMMPDMLFPVGALAIYLLAFGGGRLTRFERLALAAVVAFAIACHMAMLALALGLVVVLALADRLLTLRSRPRLGHAAAAAAFGVVLALISNAIIAGQFAFTPGGASFLFGRLVEDGIVTRYLDHVCPEPTLRICPYRDQISRGYDDWLWKNDTPFWKLGGWKGYSGEERRIILATIVSDPVAHVTTAIEHSVVQFLSFRTEVATDRGENALTIDTIRERFPSIYPRLRAAPQQTDRFNIAFVNWVHVPVGFASIVALLVLVAVRRRTGLAPQTTAFCATALAALAINAVVCGVFSHPAERYQSRLVPIAPLAAIVAFVGRKRTA